MFKKRISLTQCIRKRDKIIELARLEIDVWTSYNVREISLWSFIVNHRSEILRSRKSSFIVFKRIIELHDELRGWVVCRQSIYADIKKHIDLLPKKHAKKYPQGYFLTKENFEKLYRFAVDSKLEKINYAPLLQKLREKTKKFMTPQEVESRTSIKRDYETGGIIFDS